MMSGTIICTRGRPRIICDVCDGDYQLAKFEWRDRQIDLCAGCRRNYGEAEEWRAWADRVIARNLNVHA